MDVSRTDLHIKIAISIDDKQIVKKIINNYSSRIKWQTYIPIITGNLIVKMSKSRGKSIELIAASAMSTCIEAHLNWNNDSKLHKSVT